MKSEKVERHSADSWGHAVLVCFVLLISSCYEASAGEVGPRRAEDSLNPGEIRGRLQCENGGPVADALIYAPGDSLTAVTDSTGSFVMRLVPRGTYTLKISWDAGDGQLNEVNVLPKAVTDLGVVKMSCPANSPCLGKADGIPCDDDDNCTLNDACSNGACTGKPLDCNDDNQCTEDECTPIVGCTHRALTGSECDDGDACTRDVCTDGVCTGTPVDCSDKNLCTEDRCDRVAGCLHQPLEGAECDDNNPCTVKDKCGGGICSGEPVKCDDNNPCTIDSCDLARGCVYTPVSGLPCDDSDPCTSNDVCQLGRCTGHPMDCDDGNICTDDTCMPAKGCVHTRRSGPGCPT